ncbi:uncharacterized protein I206_102146 [Kwoniella pini CBS 10737]|uniref:Ricin B lectin domain-containing protein n=1 Tax=Kwoniella pini CBS 10737 TaxID=1296096 RepID=A0A1B9HUP0_9TREE|nr:uncharacterized protein I206_06760 [Kwoniella pini CBS 10737]OCF46986.1 hypothetical protein I206_06760 [Kwoniella pini CBS 10737]
MFIYLLAILATLSFIASSPTLETHRYDKRYSGVKIQAYRNGLCLSPIGRTLSNGVPVGAVDCAIARTWNINPGSGSVTLSGYPQWALDAGTGSQNGEGVKIWQSFPGVFQQTWYLTTDRRIAITGGNQCLDKYDDDAGVHIWQCGADNINQIWTIVQPNSPFTPTPGQASILNPPIGQTQLDPVHQGVRIHPYQRPDLAVTVTGGLAAFDKNVDISYDQSNTGAYAALQLWYLPSPGTFNSVVLLYTANNNYCLDVGVTPTDGIRVKLHDCDTIENTRWDWDGTHLKVTGTNYCLDVRAESSPTHSIPYDTLKTLQIWTCSPGNHNQEFFTIARKA